MDDGIELEMDNYMNSLKDVKDIRKAKIDEELTKLEMKEYRKITGKILWLANNTRPDLCYTALSMSKKNTSATISDLRDISRIFRRLEKGVVI